jgi:hypothetical protein
MVDPFSATTICLIGMLFAFHWGRYSFMDKITEEIIAKTIDNLTEAGYIAVTKNSKGEIELIKIEDLTKEDLV